MRQHYYRETAYSSGWEFVRRTHLTHIYGDGDPMVQVNIQEQESRFADLRQADRELLSSFKLRFDNQVKADTEAGVTLITDSKRALDFFCKLNPKRYRSMLAKMRNSALNMVAIGGIPNCIR